MWSNEIYLIPIVLLLSIYKLDEDIHLEGELKTEFPKLIRSYVPEKSLTVEVDSTIMAHIDCEYSRATNLGKIFMEIVQNFSLKPEINAIRNDNAIVKVILKEDVAWMP